MADYRVYTPVSRDTYPVDMEKCRKSMYGIGYGRSQCARKAVVEEEGYGWCKQHAPSAVKAQQDAKSAKYAAQRKRSDYLTKQARLEHDVVTAAMNWGDHGKGDGPLMEAYQALRKHLTESE